MLKCPCFAQRLTANVKSTQLVNITDNARANWTASQCDGLQISPVGLSQYLLKQTTKVLS